MNESVEAFLVRYHDLGAVYAGLIILAAGFAGGIGERILTLVEEEIVIIGLDTFIFQVCTGEYYHRLLGAIFKDNHSGRLIPVPVPVLCRRHILRINDAYGIIDAGSGHSAHTVSDCWAFRIGKSGYLIHILNHGSVKDHLHLSLGQVLEFNLAVSGKRTLVKETFKSLIIGNKESLTTCLGKNVPITKRIDQGSIILEGVMLCHAINFGVKTLTEGLINTGAKPFWESLVKIEIPSAG
jgi:hypothetical protein